MKLSQFKFELPEEQIALNPPTYRDECRLMVLHRKSQTIDMYQTDKKGKPLKGEDKQPKFLTFANVIDHFDEGDTFVFNDTKVFPARLYGTKEKTDAKIEVFLQRELNKELRLWDVIVEPARKIRIGNKLFFDNSSTMVAEVIDNTTSRGRTLRFLYDGPYEEFKRELFALGEAPLPHYIVDRRPATPDDQERFQSLFARHEGAVTAPASSLHFSRELLKRMEIKGINFAYLTVHCTLGNFRSIEVEDLSKFKMTSEQIRIEKECCELVNKSKTSGRHVCLVGTSVEKAVETATGTDKLLKEYDGWTNKFVCPPYEPGVADSMIANFYLPMSTLIIQACAFGGHELVMEAYRLAVENGYRFGCYGDAMLMLND